MFKEIRNLLSHEIKERKIRAFLGNCFIIPSDKVHVLIKAKSPNDYPIDAKLNGDALQLVKGPGYKEFNHDCKRAAELD